jgi:hypothetical protein
MSITANCKNCICNRCYNNKIGNDGECKICNECQCQVENTITTMQLCFNDKDDIN